MTVPTPTCPRCGRDLDPTPDSHIGLPWWDSARVRAQGWVGQQPDRAIGLECLTHEEADFLLPDPRRRPLGRFRRGPRPAAARPTP